MAQAAFHKPRALRTFPCHVGCLDGLGRRGWFQGGWAAGRRRLKPSTPGHAERQEEALCGAGCVSQTESVKNIYLPSMFLTDAVCGSYLSAVGFEPTRSYLQWILSRPP